MRISCILCAATILCTSTCHSEEPANGPRNYLLISGVSHHFESRGDGKKWNQENWGLGYERQYDLLTATAGYYQNSYARDTFYAGARWEPLRFSIVRLGIQSMLASGYKSPIVGGLTLSATGDGYGILVLGAPKIAGNTPLIVVVLRIGF